MILMQARASAVAQQDLPKRHLKLIPLSEFNYFYENNQAPEDSSLDWPEVRSTSLVLELSPFDSILDTAQVTLFVQAQSYFYEQIFDSQSDYNLHVRNIDIVDQDLFTMGPSSKTTKTTNNGDSPSRLMLETTVTVNFRPATTTSTATTPEQQQDLTNDELQRILVHLTNRFESHLLTHLQNNEDEVIFAKLEHIAATTGQENDDNNVVPQEGDSDWGAIVAVSCASVVILVAIFATYRLYK